MKNICLGNFSRFYILVYLFCEFGKTLKYLVRKKYMPNFYNVNLPKRTGLYQKANKCFKAILKVFSKKLMMDILFLFSIVFLG